MAVIGNLVAQLKANTQDFDRKMKRAQTTSERFSTALKTTGKVAAAAFTAMAATAGLVVRHISNISTELDKLAKQAKVLDIQTSSLQFLKFASERAGVSYEMMSSTMERLAFRVNAASRGNAIYKNSLAEIGLEAKELTKLPIDEQLRKVMSALKDIPNRSDQINIIRQLGGREAVKMLNLVNEDIDKLADTFSKLNLQLSARQSSAIENYRDRITDVSTAWSGFSQQVTAEVVPAFSDILEELFNSRAGFNDLRETARSVAATIIDVTAGMIEGFELFLSVIDRAREGLNSLGLDTGGLKMATNRLAMVGRAILNFSVDPTLIGTPEKGVFDMSQHKNADQLAGRFQQTATNLRARANDLRDPTLQTFISITDKLNTHFGGARDSVADFAEETKKAAVQLSAIGGTLSTLKTQKIGEQLERILGVEMRQAFGGLSRVQTDINNTYASQVKRANPNISDERLKSLLPFQEQTKQTGSFDAGVRGLFTSVQNKNISEKDFASSLQGLRSQAVSLGPQFTGVIDDLHNFGKEAGLVKDKKETTVNIKGEIKVSPDKAGYIQFVEDGLIKFTERAD